MSEASSSTNFNPAKQKLKIGTVDYPGKQLEVSAQFNPKELQVDKPVQWAKHNMANKTEAAKERGELHLEFTGAESRTMQVELLFDGFEQKKSVADQVGTLETMASVMKASSPKEDDRRPPLCVVTWGDRGLPSFRCVIESLSTKYTMFDTDGTPLRATCTVKLKEATKLTTKDAEHDDKKGKGGAPAGGGK
jgi:hypothetical protein